MELKVTKMSLENKILPININKTYQIKLNDIENAGTIASSIKLMLKRNNFDRAFIKRVTIGLYEAEINVTIHSYGGNAKVEITDEYVEITFNDNGPGIECIESAMNEGFSTASSIAIENGFGAGMGLPNIKSVSDEMDLESSSSGTVLRLKFNVNSDKFPIN